MLFTLYGDYVIHRGGEAWVGSLIRIAAHFGLSEQALRSALSRMARNDWLTFRRLGGKSYYSLTGKSHRLLEEGSQRIFQRRTAPWDGCWRLLSYSVPERQRELRDQLRKRLAYLGFGALTNGTWLTPHPLEEETRQLVESLGLAGCVELFTARHLGFASDAELAGRCWDLAELARRYRAFLAHQRPCFEMDQRRLEGGVSVEGSECFVHRFLLIYEYRRFFFLDPELPRELLPGDWPGWEAAELFRSYHTLLAERANRYVDAALEAPARRPGTVDHGP